jgi:DNA-binding IclR family transcriptional regulator
MMAAPDPRGTTIADLARLVVQDLSDATGAEVRLGVLHRTAAAFMEKKPGRSPVTGFSPDQSVPLHATAIGKALLAFAPPALFELITSGELRSYTPFTITSAGRLRESLAMARRTQLAVSRSELSLDRSAIAMPVFGSGGRIAAAIEVRVDEVSSELPHVKPALLVASRSLSRELISAPAQFHPPRISSTTFVPLGELRAAADGE